MTSELRPAAIRDAALLARLCDMADDGLPRLVWAAETTTGRDIWAVGTETFARLIRRGPAGHLLLSDKGAAPTGAVWTYPMTDPRPPEEAAFADLVPLMRLKTHLAGDWYVDFLAVLPEHRGRGLGRSLLAGALDAARAGGARRIGLIALDSNATAIALYGSAGFVAVASEPLVNAAWKTGAASAVLMTRAL